MLILKSLHIELNTYGQLKGEYTGHIKYLGGADGTAMVELPLTHAISSSLLKVIGPQIVESSKRIAETLTIDAIEQIDAVKELPDRFI